MKDVVESMRIELREAVRGLDATALRPLEAKALVEAFAEMGRLCDAGKTLAAPTVAASTVWARNGCRPFEEWLAQVSGTGVGEAITTSETAKRLEHLPSTEQALREGKLSRVQVNEVASAATADPESEATLLHTAEHRPVRTLKQKAEQVKAAARDDELARYRRIKRNRMLRTWDDSEGSNLHFRSTADDLAVVKNAIEAYVPAIFDAARTADEREPMGAYRADALVALARDATGIATETKKRLPKAEMRIRIDLPAFRGAPERGEVCEIPGIGPIPVAVARAAMPDAIVDLVVTQGQDVRAIVTHNRTVRHAVQVALEERYPTCAKWDCDATAHLENDHIEDFARTRHTMYDELVRWCPHHHDLKTNRGYVPVQLDDGDWDLKPPDAQIVDGRAPPDERAM